MLAKRIVPCLDIKDGQTVKGTNFVNLRQAGDPVELGRAYSEQGLDNILRDAPHLILAMAQKDFVRGRENSVFSLAYLELFAPSLGLGSCWAGIVEMCIFAGS